MDIFDAVHPFDGHTLDEVFAVLVGHCAHRSLFLGHFVVAVFQVLQQVGKPDELAGADQGIICAMINILVLVDSCLKYD